MVQVLHAAERVVEYQVLRSVSAHALAKMPLSHAVFSRVSESFRRIPVLVLVVHAPEAPRDSLRSMRGWRGFWRRTILVPDALSCVILFSCRCFNSILCLRVLQHVRVVPFEGWQPNIVLEPTLWSSIPNSCHDEPWLDETCYSLCSRWSLLQSVVAALRTRRRVIDCLGQLISCRIGWLS